MMTPELALVIKDINKKHGDETVFMAGDIQGPLPRFESGSLGLDMILGGGWPGNTWNELIGESSHGKTAVALKTIAANQAANPEFTAVWVAAEEFVPEYAAMCGVDLDRVVLVETNIMEHAFDAVLKFAESKAVDAVVIDSLPALVPLPEDEKDMDQMTVGKGALLTNKFFRKTTSTMKRSLLEEDRAILGIVINQFRMKIGVMHGDPRTTPGGVGKDYSYFSRVEVKRDGWIEIGKGDNKQRVGQSIRLRTVKNKTAPPQQTSYVDFYFADAAPTFRAGEYDFGRELVNLAHHYDILERAGSWFSFAGQRWQGADAVVLAVREDLDLREEMSRQVMEVRRK